MSDGWDAAETKIESTDDKVEDCYSKVSAAITIYFNVVLVVVVQKQQQKQTIVWVQCANWNCCVQLWIAIGHTIIDNSMAFYSNQ